MKKCNFDKDAKEKLGEISGKVESIERRQETAEQRKGVNMRNTRRTIANTVTAVLSVFLGGGYIYLLHRILYLIFMDGVYSYKEMWGHIAGALILTAFSVAIIVGIVSIIRKSIIGKEERDYDYEREFKKLREV